MELNRVVLLHILSILFTVGGATEYFVSHDGDDSNPGTLEKPWRHIQKAVTMLSPGDICTVREGQYSEEIVISGLKGTQDNPITFRSFPGELVTFDGTIPISGSWEKYKGDIYVTTLDEDVWQLFVDGEMQINARWPNSFWYDYSVFDYTKWGFASADSTFNPTMGTGVIVDNGKQGLAKSGLNATGAIAILNIGSWLTWAGVVERHTQGEDRFDFDLRQKIGGYVDFHGQNSRYFLEDKLEFLDAPSEWFFDADTKKLFLWTRDSDQPEAHDVHSKVSTYAFVITNSSTWLVLSDLNFFATTVFISGKGTSDDVSNIRLESVHFSYPSYSKRMLGSLAVPNMTTIFFNGLLSRYAGNFSVFNCTWEYADGHTMRYRGADGMFENNLWHHNDFTCVGNGQLFKSIGVRDTFVRNTIHSNGPSVGYSPGTGLAKDRNLGLSIASNITLNLFYDLKYLQDDGAHVQTNIYSQNGTVIEYNWSYDTMKNGLRFDRGTEEGAPWGYNGTMRCNVIWKTRGLQVKGDYHHLENNLCFDGELSHDLTLLGYPGSGVEGENTHTVTIGNIFQLGVCTSYNEASCTYIPGNFTNNVVVDVRKHLRDPDNLDFRPNPDSDYINNKIGPYGKESVSPGGVYWIPGRQQLLASMPIPPNGTTTAKCSADLMWLSGYGAQAHSVYFGTNKTAVATAVSPSPEFVYKLNVPANIAGPQSELKPGLMYYWRIDVHVNDYNFKDVVNTGLVWQFECM